MTNNIKKAEWSFGKYGVHLTDVYTGEIYLFIGWTSPRRPQIDINRRFIEVGLGLFEFFYVWRDGWFHQSPPPVSPDERSEEGCMVYLYVLNRIIIISTRGGYVYCLVVLIIQLRSCGFISTNTVKMSLFQGMGRANALPPSGLHGPR